MFSLAIFLLSLLSFSIPVSRSALLSVIFSSNKPFSTFNFNISSLTSFISACVVSDIFLPVFVKFFICLLILDTSCTLLSNCWLTSFKVTSYILVIFPSVTLILLSISFSASVFILPALLRALLIPRWNLSSKTTLLFSNVIILESTLPLRLSNEVITSSLFSFKSLSREVLVSLNSFE